MYFEVIQDTKGEFRWRLKAANHEIIADSAEGYTRRESCINGINLVKQGAADAPIK